jgi:hypothetical protein
VANTLLTIDKVTNEAVRVLHSNTSFLKNVNKEYDDQFAQSGAKIGDTLRVRKPPKFTVRDGRVMSVQNATETYVSLPCTTQKGVDLNFTSAEFAMSIDDFSSRFLKPSMSVLGAVLDYTSLAMTLDVANSVGTPGTTPATYQVWGDAGAKLDDALAPRDGDRTAILSPAAMARTVDGLKGLFQAGDAIADQYRSGIMTRAIDLKWAIDQNVRSVTMGSRAGTTLVTCPTAAPASGSTQIQVDGFTGATDTIKKGEVVTFGSVFDVNAETKQTLTNLKQFAITSDTTCASNKCALPISPAMYDSTSGALQNVSAMPADNAAVTFYGTTSATVYPQNLVFHKDAFTFATADLKLPKSAEMAARKVQDGISLRIWEGADITNDQFPTRSDVLFGFATIYPELACRVWG